MIQILLVNYVVLGPQTVRHYPSDDVCGEVKHTTCLPMSAGFCPSGMSHNYWKMRNLGSFLFGIAYVCFFPVNSSTILVAKVLITCFPENKT